MIFDLWYIGQIGVSELAGVAYIFPIYMLTSMLSNGAFGGAISGAIARAFGSKNIFQAECVFRSAILIACFGSLIMMFIFFLLAEPDAGSGFMEIVSDWNEPDPETEFEVLKRIVKKSGRPVVFSCTQRHDRPHFWEDLMSMARQAQKEGVGKG